jgi:hypothetical protein
LYVRKDTKEMNDELKEIMKKIEELREEINKIVLDNSLGDDEVINKSRIMDWHLNRFQELISSKNEQNITKIDRQDNLINGLDRRNMEYKKKLELELVNELENELEKQFKKEKNTNLNKINERTNEKNKENEEIKEGKEVKEKI